MSRPTHLRLPPPLAHPDLAPANAQQHYHPLHIPPAFSIQIVYTFPYYGVTAIGNSTWEQLDGSVYALDGGEDVTKSAAAEGLKRAGSLSASAATSSGLANPRGSSTPEPGSLGSANEGPSRTRK
ncbi:hypothetical protein FRB90_002978 [Tulasnella sp. 427]|nr:hypothetical protein FRB90_002978 [Tulasnella sp. 427]